MWSIGCVAQELLEGFPPYKEIGMIKGSFKTATIGAMGLRNPTKISKECREFVEKCFIFDYKKRPMMDELLKLPFFAIAEQSPLRRMLKEVDN